MYIYFRFQFRFRFWYRFRFMVDHRRRRSTFVNHGRLRSTTVIRGLLRSTSVSCVSCFLSAVKKSLKLLLDLSFNEWPGKVIFFWLIVRVIRYGHKNFSLLTVGKFLKEFAPRWINNWSERNWGVGSHQFTSCSLVKKANVQFLAEMQASGSI